MATYRRGSTIVEKVAEVSTLALRIKYAAEQNDYKKVQALAAHAKKVSQAIKAHAARSEKRHCTHSEEQLTVEYGLVHHWDGKGHVADAYARDCGQCGKRKVVTRLSHEEYKS